MDILELRALAQLLGRPTARVANRASGPNLEMSGRELIMWTVWQRIGAGRSAWELEWQDPSRPRATSAEVAGKPGAQIVGLWPIPAALIKPKPSPRGKSYFDGYVVDGANNMPAHLSNDQVFYGWWKGPNDIRQPVAPLQATRYAVTLAVMSDRYNHAFLKNGAVPATVVTTEAFASDDERRAFRRDWEAKYQGPDKAGRTMFYEAEPRYGDETGGVGDTLDIKTLGLAQRDAQFAQSHLQALKEVAWGLGVPWSKIDSADRTFSNAEAEERSWMLERVVPFLETLADEINLRLAPMLGREVCWFDLSGVEALRPTPRFSFSEGVQGWAAGLLLPGEVREEFGLDPDVELPTPVAPELPALPAGGVPDAPALPAADPASGTENGGRGGAGGRDGLGAAHHHDQPPAHDDPPRPGTVRGRDADTGSGGAGEHRGLTPEQQEAFLSKATPEQRAKVGR